jgi:hypothetical protein
VRKIGRITAVTAVVAAGLGLTGWGDGKQAQARPGPFPQWCPGDYWDSSWDGDYWDYPGYDDNWDWYDCPDNNW